MVHQISRNGQIYFCSLRFFFICCSSALYGPLVKRLRLRPLTPASGVRFSHGSPIFPLACVRSLCKLLKSLLFFCSMWTISSVGESNRLITGGSGVRVPDGPPHFLSRGIAQLVEQRSPKPRAEGSNPSAPARVFSKS